MSRLLTRLAAGAGAASLVAVMAACSGGAAAQAPTSAGTPIEGGTIVYGHQQEPECVFGGWIEQAYLSYQVLDSLTSLDENGKAVPWLATTWETSANGRTWTFHLKDDVKFTDGTPLTAGAVAANFDWWVEDGGNSTARAWLTPYYKSAKAVDDSTLELHLTAAYPRLAETLAQGYFGIQSQKSLGRSAEEICSKPIGSGAFKVDHWDRGQEIVLVRNDDYTSWPANALHEGPAKVEKVEWKFVADPTTRTASLRSGETDVIYDVPAVEWDALGKAGFQELKYVTPGRPQQLSFNTVQGPFTDQKVRQAFAYSLDRRQIVDTIGRGLIPYDGNGAVSQATPGYSKKAADAYTYDVAKANQLLDAAGWTQRDKEGIRVKDGKPLHVILPYGAGSVVNADGGAILQGVKEQAKAVGFDVELVPVPRSASLAGAYTKPNERDIQVGYWTSVTAGILWITWRSNTTQAPNGSNGAFYADKKLDALILRANSEPDVDRQNALYEQAQEYIADRALSIGLYDRLSTLAVSPHLKDVWQEHAQGGPVFHDAYLVG